MKFRTLLRRLRTSAQVLRGDPGVLLRAPRFVWRTLKEGPRASLDRLRRISDPLRFSVDYEAWRAEFGTTAEEKQAMAAWAEALPQPVPIAVLMPVFNPKPEWLQAAIDSVRAQLYPHWQLCIADDRSTDPRIQPLLEAAMAADPRIQVVFRERNGHICASSNSALELVQAPWVALLDHDDLLPDEALIWVAKAIAEHPQARLFYSDEDKLSPAGELFDPYFKGDWNPVLMEGQNMSSHLGVYATDLVRRVGGFREGFEGSQDHDLVLRCSEQLRREQIVHIPRVLYHWRVHPQSTAGGAKAKPYTVQAAERAISEHLQRRALPLRQISWTPVGFRAELALPELPPRVSVIIPTRNGLQVLRPCLISLLERTRYPDFEVLVVDNGSDDPATLQFLAGLEQQGQIRVLPDPSPFNYSALNNRAVNHASGELICLLNNDIEVVDPGWLEELVVQALRTGVGAVGARLLYPNRTLQHGGVLLGVGGVANHAHLGWPGDHPGYFSRAQLTQEMAAVTGACLLVRRSHYEAVGGLNEEQLKVAFNDVDFCLKLREQGLQNVYAPAARLIHHESVSRGQDLSAEKAARFAAEVDWMQQRWGDQLPHDPAYNPNLSLDNPHFRLAWPPRVERWASS
ncbi:glycosyltransferase family 2 protein [Synechococcus sp. CB0101]|uniref:glycosyltransferase family 2 protein n=1 Tax=Synechococcus sp. CB0101 TaxID=232348 RepID=UPI0002001C0B|nr:glycosyltransferase family 2 protein [Synechococcus sp. CB0101]